MRVRLVCGSVLLGALVLCASTVAQQTMTVSQLLSFIRSSIKLKQPDKEVAGYVSRIKLSEKLDERTVEELQGEGAGPKTVAALNEIAAASASLPAPQPKAAKAPPPPIPPPPPEEQQAIISEIREYARNYSKSLPDFICTQVTRKYVDRRSSDYWQPVLTVMEHLTYFEQQEHYKVSMVNDRSVDLSHEQLGGAGSSGDFGSMLKVTLNPKADALVEFDRWGKLRGKICYVFSYRISSGNSEYSILWERTDRIITAYRGLIYVDKDTHLIIRLTLEAVDIPASFPVQEASEILDYDYVKISDREFLLPLKAQVFMRHDRERTRNDIDFRAYRKYSAEAVIQFDTETPDPIPEDQTKEQPVQPPGQPPK